MKDADIIEYEKVAYRCFKESEKQPLDYRIYAARLEMLAKHLKEMPNLKADYIRRSKLYRKIAVDITLVKRY